MEGELKENRTGDDTKGVYALRMKRDQQDCFPQLTTKRVHWPSIIWELLWFMRGETNVKWLHDKGVTIWDEWADESGELGPVYGKQWRSWPCLEEFGPQTHVLTYHDQLGGIVDTLQTNPNDRRMVVSAWNVGQIDKMALPPCHLLFQFYVREGQYLDCQMYQRSCDMFLGVPFNIASYSALVHIIAHITGLKPGRFYWVGGDCHIYVNHFKQVDKQLGRKAKPSPSLAVAFDAPRDLDGDWDIKHFDLVDYNPHPGIKAEVAV